MIDIPTITSADQVRAALKQGGVCIGRVKPADYHAWKSQLPNSISKSGLVDYMRDPYAYHWATTEGAKKESAALRWGTLMDTLLLTPELMPELYAVEEINRRTNAGRERAAELEAQGKTILTPAEYDEAQRAAAIAQGGLQRALGAGAQTLTQVGVWRRVERINDTPLAVPLTVCGMLDMLADVNGKRYILDLKTTSAALVDERELNRTIATYAYGIQAAMYEDLYAAATGELAFFSLFFLSSAAPYRTRAVTFTADDVAEAHAAYQAALVRYAQSVAAGDWGAPELPPMVYARPGWMKGGIA